MAYEDLVRTFWRTYRPAEVERMGNTGLEEFVRGRSEEIVEQIGEVADDLVPTLREGTDVVERAGEVKNARFRARSMVLQEMVYGMEKEPGTETKDMPRVSLPPL